MSFKHIAYTAPDFDLPQFVSAPDAMMAEVTIDGTAPENYHATGIYPEYLSKHICISL